MKVLNSNGMGQNNRNQRNLWIIAICREEEAQHIRKSESMSWVGGSGVARGDGDERWVVLEEAAEERDALSRARHIGHLAARVHRKLRQAHVRCLHAEPRGNDRPDRRAAQHVVLHHELLQATRGRTMINMSGITNVTFIRDIHVLVYVLVPGEAA